MKSCPCCSGRDYGHCCEPAHSGSQPPTTPEALMRARYSAFALGNIAFLLETIATTHTEPSDHETITKTLESTEWCGLHVISASQEEALGEVEFVAFFKHRDTARQGIQQLHERSHFVHTHQWFYTTGEQLPNIKWQRNQLCFCGSGQKYKRCCAG